MTRRTLAAITTLTITAAVILADQARHTVCPCGGCGSQR